MGRRTLQSHHYTPIEVLGTNAMALHVGSKVVHSCAGVTSSDEQPPADLHA